ncbi:glutamyl-tRNA synthetase [Sarocladium strictum]
MTTLDVAAKGTPSLVYSAFIVKDFVKQLKLLPEITESFHNTSSLVGKASVSLTAVDGSTFHDWDLLNHLSKLASDAAGFPTISIMKWIERSKALSAPNFRQVQASLEELNAHLTLRSHIAGYNVSCADLVVWAVLSSNHVALSWIREAQNSVTRWYNYLEASISWAKEALNEVHAASSQDKIATRPIVTRFPPEPSGYLHIGHAKAALLNEYFARLRPGGCLICRFDDTNPTNENSEFQGSILEDLKSIEVVPDKITYSSDNFQVMHDYAVQLIKDGKALADDSELWKGDESRKNRPPSKHRDMRIDETLQRFGEMKTGSAEGQKWALRARIAYDSPNGTLRDPVIYRCDLTPHHRTGGSWKVYPTYDFCAPVLDSIEGITVALRTNEYRDRNAQYDWIQEALGVRKVPIWNFARLNLVRTVLSKRKMMRIVNDGRFILRQGPSRNVVNMQWDVFWATNRRYVDPAVPRHTAIAADGAVPCNIKGTIESMRMSKAKHPKNASLGEQDIFYGPKTWIEEVDAARLEEGEEITLMSWGNAFVRKITRDDAGNVSAVDLELHLSGDVKKTQMKVGWLADRPGNLLTVDLVSFDYLITKDKLEKTDDVEQFLTPVTEFHAAAYGDCNVADLPVGTTIQFERKGFSKLDVARKGQGCKAVFFDVPTN